MCRILSLVGLAVALACGSNAIARGNLITNGSFESPTVADGGNVDIPSPWLASTSDTEAQSMFAVVNPQDVYMPGTTYVSPAQPGNLPSPADGLQLADAWVRPGYYTYIEQTVVGDPSINTVYTLTFDVGLQLTNPSPRWDAYLYSGTGWVEYAHMSSGDVGVNLPTAGTFVENKISWTNTTTTTGDLLVLFKATGKVEGASLQEIAFDNVRLTVENVPEPGTLLLLATGLIGLLAYAWRKRR